MRDVICNAAYNNSRLLGWRGIEEPDDWWKKSPKWRSRIEHDLARPVRPDRDDPHQADTTNEDDWGTAYLIAHGSNLSRKYNPSTSDAEQDTAIRYLCFLIRRKADMSQAVISEYYGTGGGWGFDIPVLREYPVAALARNVLVVRPALAAMLASDDSASGATLLYATLSQDWSVELTIDYFDRQAQAERVRNCKEVWFEVYGIARGYNSLSKDSPASRAGAMTVLEAIRSGDWPNKPREIYGDYTGKQIDEEIKKYPWPPKPRTPTTASAPSQPPPE